MAEMEFNIENGWNMVYKWYNQDNRNDERKTGWTAMGPGDPAGFCSKTAIRKVP